MSFFRLQQASAETLPCIWQTPVLVASSFAIVPKSWRLSADHVWGNVAGSDLFLTAAVLAKLSPSSWPTSMRVRRV